MDTNVSDLLREMNISPQQLGGLLNLLKSGVQPEQSDFQGQVVLTRARQIRTTAVFKAKLKGSEAVVKVDENTFDPDKMVRLDTREDPAKTPVAKKKG